MAKAGDRGKRDSEKPSSRIMALDGDDIRQALEAAGTESDPRQPRYLDALGIYELRRRLEDLARQDEPDEENIKAARNLIRQRLEYYLPHVLFDVARDRDCPRLAYMTYYSNLIPRTGEQRDRDTFSRVPVTPLIGFGTGETKTQVWHLKGPEEPGRKFASAVEVMAAGDRATEKKHIERKQAFAQPRKPVESEPAGSARLDARIVEEIEDWLSEEAELALELLSDAPIRLYWREQKRATWEENVRPDADGRLPALTGEQGLRLEDAFLRDMVETAPCLPVNLAEALSVDMHLTSGLFGALVEKTLTHPKWNGGTGRLERLRWWMKAGDDPAADAPLFRDSDADDFEAFIKALRNWFEAPDVRREIRDQVEEEAKRLWGGGVRFCFPRVSGECAGIPLEALRELAIRLFLGEIDRSDILDRLLAGEAVRLRELVQAESPGRRESSAEESAWGREQLRGHWFSVYPSLPFFLAALLLRGTYRDLLYYIAPCFTLDVQEIHVETVDRSQSLEALLFEMAFHWEDVKPIMERAQGRRTSRSEGGAASAGGNLTTMAQCLNLLIRRNGFGNLTILQRSRRDSSRDEPTTGPAGPPRKAKMSCLGRRMSSVKCAVRSIFMPLRHLEQLVEVKVSRDREVERMARAYRGIIHDLRNDVFVLGGMLSTFKPSEGRMVQRSLSLRDLLREDAPPGILCSLPPDNEAEVSDFWWPLRERSLALEGLDRVRDARSGAADLFDQIKAELDLFREYFLKSLDRARPDDRFMRDVTGAEFVRAVDLSCSMVPGGSAVRRNLKINIPEDRTFEQHCVAYITMALKMAIHNAAKFSGKPSAIRGGLSLTEEGGFLVRLVNPVDVEALSAARGTRTRRQMITEMGQWLYGRRFSEKHTYQTEIDLAVTDRQEPYYRIEFRFDPIREK